MFFLRFKGNVLNIITLVLANEIEPFENMKNIYAGSKTISTLFLNYDDSKWCISNYILFVVEF